MICNNCNHNNHSSARFCSHCGAELLAPVYAGPQNSGNITKTVLFFITQVVFLVILCFIDFSTDYRRILFADAIFICIVLIFFLSDFKNSLRLFRFDDPKPLLLILLSAGAPILAALVFFFVGYLNNEVFNQTVISEYYLLQDSPAPFMFTIISMAVIPAVFEELAFRGVMFNMLEPMTGTKPAIFVTAVMFTALHLSIVSVLWIFPIGLLFGYLRARYNTLMYGIIGHFVYNGSVVFYEVLLA